MNVLRHPWTVDYLSSLPDQELDRVGKQAAAGLAVARLRVGRVILAMQRTGLPRRLGYKNALHYFKLAGARYVEARECLRVARECERLPLLRAAAETGGIGWTNLREVVRVATPETEADWMEKCRRHTSKEVQKMVKHTKAGQARLGAPLTGALPTGALPTDALPTGAPRPPSAGPSAGPPDAGPQEVGPVDLRLKLPAGFNALLGRATRKLSEQAGRQLSPAQVVECLLAHYLTGHAFPGPMMWNRLLGQSSPNPAASSEPEEDSRESSDAPWEAVAASQEPCPGEAELQIVRPAPAHWEPTEAQRHEAFCCACPDCPEKVWLEVHNLVSYCEGGVIVPDQMLVLCPSCYNRVHSGQLLVARRAEGGLRWSDMHGRDLLDLAPDEWPEHWLDIVDEEMNDDDLRAFEAELDDTELDDTELDDTELEDGELEDFDVEDDGAVYEAFWPREDRQSDDDAVDDGEMAA